MVKYTNYYFSIKHQCSGEDLVKFSCSRAYFDRSWLVDWLWRHLLN